MATTIERRVAALEESAGGGGKCPECGLGPEDDRKPVEVEFMEDGDDPDAPDEPCSECGRLLFQVIGWGDGA